MQHKNTSVVEFQKLQEVVQVLETLAAFYLSLKLIGNNLSLKYPSSRLIAVLLPNKDLLPLSNSRQRHTSRALFQSRLSGQLISPVSRQEAR